MVLYHKHIDNCKCAWGGEGQNADHVKLVWKSYRKVKKGIVWKIMAHRFDQNTLYECIKFSNNKKFTCETVANSVCYLTFKFH